MEEDEGEEQEEVETQASSKMDGRRMSNTGQQMAADL